ncbi:MAG: BamA/TamA family outer membrane protein [Salinivirgaceae bacterium]|nr:BamA/TamA family outer membrane protein [Salinivirgaceae bacterium]
MLKFQALIPTFSLVCILLLLYNPCKGQVQASPLVDTVAQDSLLQKEEPFINIEINKQLRQLLREGYMESSVDFVNKKSPTLFTGSRYKWGVISCNDSTLKKNKALQKIQFKNADVLKLEAILIDIVKNKTSSGYPFYAIEIKHEIKKDNSIDLEIISQGKTDEIRIDTIVFPSDLKIKHGFVKNYLGLHIGDKYNLQTMKEIQESITRLPFLSLTSPITSRFSTSGAILEMPIKAKTTGSFGGVLGFSNDQATDKIKITGDINLKLTNALKQGESISLLWNKTEKKSQYLVAEVELPYIFNSPFGVFSDIDLQKIDTTELRLKNSLMAIYHLKGLNQFRVGVNNQSQRYLGSQDTNHFDTKIFLYQIGLLINKLDHITLPNKGIKFHGNIEAGNRQANDSLEQKENLYKLKNTLSIYSKVSTNSSIHTAMAMGIIKSNKKLWEGELFQLGGHNTFRGFDEKSIQANQYFYVTLEYQYRLEKESRIFSFLQSGKYWVNTISQNRNSVIASGGVGAIIDSGVGVFSIIYALGYDSNQKFKFQNSKIHFGYLAKF